MITEVMTLLIAVGAVMIFIVWNQSKKRRQQADERREVEESTGKLKQELEKTANEVIGKMENQASTLEDLIDEAEKNHTILEGRVAELRKLLKRSEGQSTEIRDLLSKLEEAGDTVEELQRRLEAAEKRIAASMQVQVPQIPMQMPMQSTMLPMSNPMMTPMMTPPPIMTTPLPNVPSPISPPPILSSRQPINSPSSLETTTSKTTAAVTESKPTSTQTTRAASTTTKTKTTTATAITPPKRDKAEIKKALEKASLEPEKAEPKDFEQVLAKSMANERSEIRAVNVPDRRSIVIPSKTNQRVTVVEREPVKIESKIPETPTVDRMSTKNNSANKNSNVNHMNNSAKIKEMLLAGLSIEDIARETGLGRGAVELVQEMTRRQLERK